jgi:hypothetical protein
MNTAQRKLWPVLAVATISMLSATASAQARHTERHMSSTRSPAIDSIGAVAWSRLSSNALVGVRDRATVVTKTGANANPATYDDPTGDNGSAPDITSVVVSNDGNGQVSFRINVAKLVVPSNVNIGIAIDSDQNPSTGSRGIDYLFLADLSQNSYGLGRWNGTDFVDASASTAAVSTDDTGLTFSINKSELGNTSGVNFWTRSLEGPTPAAGHMDDAPDAGTWAYQLGPASALKLTIELSHATKAKAGRPYVAVIAVGRSDGATAEVTSADVSCKATVGTRQLRSSTVVALGPAVTCSWRLPKGSTGKIIHASITVSLDGATVSKRFTAKIK